jgi:protein SCO1
VRGGGFARPTLIRYTRAVSTPSLRLQRLVAGLFGRPLFWAFFVGVSFSLPLAHVLRAKLPPHLPVLGTISDFELVDQNERPYGTSELRGRVWLASAIETGSPPLADKLAAELGKIQHRVVNLGPAFHLVTLGLDPAIDTQPALLEFTRHRRVSPRMWSFLSGDADGVRNARQALGLGIQGDLGQAKATTPSSPLAVILVDAQMRVRGRYELSDPDAIDTLLYHTGLLVNRGD